MRVAVGGVPLLELDLTIRVECGENPPPDTLCLFIDPLWSAVWCNKYDAKTGEFHVQTRMVPLPSAALDPFPRPPVMCDTLKLYFYTKRPTRYEFRFAAVAPMAKLVDTTVVLPAWRNTCNTCDAHALFIDHTRFHVTPNAPVVYPPPRTYPAHLELPTREYHADVKSIASWLVSNSDYAFGKRFLSTVTPLTRCL